MPKKSGIEIMSYPSAKVFLDNKEVGMTPYKNQGLKPGELAVKLITTDNKEWNRTVELKNNVDTVIDWEFGKDGQDQSGYIINMENTGDKQTGMLVNAIPDKASVSIDGEIKGFSPIKIGNIGEGDKQITVSYPGYKSITIFVKAINNYSLIIEANLAQEKAAIANDTTPTPESSPSAQQTSPKIMVTIKATETGWLRVRENPSTIGAEVGKVKPGEKYELLDENTEWYKIQLGTGKSGWISTKYAEKS